MDFELNKERPICPQICEKLCVSITCGEYKAGDRLPSVRELALLFGINPNTVQRCYEQLENRGIINSQRGSGNFVSEDISQAKAAVDALKKQKTADYLLEMLNLGYEYSEIKKIIEEWKE